MKHPLITMSLLALFGTITVAPLPAQAENSSVEAAIRSYGDLGVFYQALLNTGVINEMNENERYTIFAPTDAAFTQIERQNYPCFYSVQCRPQIAVLLRNHIIVGRYDLKELVTYGGGIRAGGAARLYVEEPFVGDYTVDGRKILSKGEVAGNIIYRIDGVITNPQELTQFQTVSYVPSGDTVTTEKTVTRKTYRSGLPETYPAGTMGTITTPADNSSQTTTVIRSYTTQSQ